MIERSRPSSDDVRRTAARAAAAVSFGILVLLALGGCGKSPDKAPEPAAGTSSSAGPVAPGPGQELPIRKIPNVPAAGEAYYAPDNLHLITSAKDKDALPHEDGTSGGLVYTFTDTGEDIRRINDRGQDACSYFFPDQKRIVWTSTRDNMDMPVGNWSDVRNYPQGPELYVSDLNGGNIVRLTKNKYYEAEASVSPDGQWVVFGRQIDGKDDLWRIRPDGTDEQQITRTDDWQEGAPFYMPDGETIMFRAPKRGEENIFPPPMTVFTIKHDGTNLKAHTFGNDMNWAPYPAPDGRHYVFVRVVDGRNWEVFLGDLEGGAPVRLTYHDGFDGLPSLSPNGKKMVFARAEPNKGGTWLNVMDVSSLNLGPENYKGKGQGGG
jgi:dipeptidyl aminopeptidase/acylaminoacyl peptidase